MHNSQFAKEKYRDRKNRIELAKISATEGMVLLKNDNNLLPLDPECSLAVFGRGQLETQTGGLGSGASDGTNASTLIDGLIGMNFNIDKDLLDCYRALLSTAEKQEVPDFMKLITSGMIYEIWGAYQAPTEEPKLDDRIIQAAAQKSDAAVVVITRNSGGEECDRRVEGDYYLQPSEKALVKQVAENFKHVIVVLNVNGLIDTAWVNGYDNIEGLIFMGLPGEAGGVAFAELLAGRVSPSGKLPTTMALCYEDYPSAEHFSYNKDKPEDILTYESYGLDATANGSTGFTVSPVTVYKEGIYTGYRYFDTFGKKVMFPFGFGLTYAEFDVSYKSTHIDVNKQVVEITVDAQNTSVKYSGKEVVQVYVSEPDGRLEKPYQRLIAYAKTKELAPEESQRLKLTFPIVELASFDESSASYVIETGDYFLRIGNSSRNTHVVGKLFVPAEIITEKLTNRLSLNAANLGKIEFLSKAGAVPVTYESEACELELAHCIGTIDRIHTNPVKIVEYSNKPMEFEYKATEYKLEDVKLGSIKIEEFVAQLSKEELAVLVSGHGKGVPFGGIGVDAPDTIQYEDGSDIGENTHTTGNNNYVSPGIKRLGIGSILYKDGPAGVRLTAWPVQMVMAGTWNNSLLYEFGNAVGEEASSLGVDSWLAPAVNLHRNPICGRNYEYFSEDAFLSGELAVALAGGVQENHNLTVCAKHFALNEQETYRRGHAKRKIDAVDSIVQERAAREVYLRPFEMLVKRTKMMNIMTSFNKINGIFAAGSRDLNTAILRDEWGFQGFVVTDWGDMDTVVDGADAMAAGNDIMMPGGPPVIKQVLAGLEEGRCTIADLQRSAEKLLKYVLNSEAYELYLSGASIDENKRFLI